MRLPCLTPMVLRDVLLSSDESFSSLCLTCSAACEATVAEVVVVVGSRFDVARSGGSEKLSEEDDDVPVLGDVVHIFHCRCYGPHAVPEDRG